MLDHCILSQNELIIIFSSFAESKRFDKLFFARVCLFYLRQKKRKQRSRTNFKYSHINSILNFGVTLNCVSIQWTWGIRRVWNGLHSIRHKYMSLTHNHDGSCTLYNVHLSRFLVEDKMHIHLFWHVATTKVLKNPIVYLFIHRLTPLFQSNVCTSFCLASVTNTKMVENALWKTSRQVTPVAASGSSWTQLSIMTAIVTVSTTATAVAGSPFLQQKQQLHNWCQFYRILIWDPTNNFQSAIQTC